MLIVQHNCGQGYESTVMALETALSVKAGIVMIQEPFIGSRELCHSGFHLYWPKGERKDIRVMTAVRKDLVDKIVVDHRTDLIDHPYFMLLEIRELDLRSKRPGRKTRVINVYDNQIGRGCTWDGGISRVRRALEDINWEPIIRGRVLIAGDINAHSPLWNPHCYRRQNASILEELIDHFGLLINNEPGRPTRPTSQGVSVIDLALSTTELGPLTLWEIPEEYPALSDHELILLRWEDIDANLPQPNISKATGWDIQGLIEDKDKFSKAQREWVAQSQERLILQSSCNRVALDQEVKWIEDTLTNILNSHAKIMRVTSYSKRWWNEEVAKARKIWAKEKKIWGQVTPNREKLKQARNVFYRIVRKAKRECWQNFLEGKEETLDPAQVRPEDKNRCWTALKYTKPKSNSTTPALVGPNNEIAVTMQDKEALVRAHAFPTPPIFLGVEYKPKQGTAHLSITKDSVGKALLCQSVKKAPGPNMHNFRILRVLWGWDPDRITSVVVQAIRLQYHPQQWRNAKGVLLEKPNKRDRTLVKSYRVISLLNCLGKVVEKVVAEQLSQFCEANGKLHKGQMGARKYRSAIDAVALLIQKVQEAWKNRKIAGALFMDVKGAFDHVSRAQLSQRMADLGIDDDFIGWTQSFLTDRWVELVIDGYVNPKHKVETGIPQGSPVSPVLFLIYISGVFVEIESRLPQVTCLSFMDDLGFLTAGNSVIDIKKILEKAGKITLDWGTRNAVTYDISKTEAMLFSKARKQKLLEQLTATELRFSSQTVRFNQEATRWLGMWLDGRLNFGAHIRERLKRAKIAEARIRGLSKTYGLPPALVRRIQIAAVQSVALYGAEIWWKNQKNHQNEIQKLINRQARSITGMYPSTPVAALMSESGLIPAHNLLDFRQRKYAYRLLSLPESIPTKGILPITLRIGDGNAQPEDQSEQDSVWASNERITTYSQRLARQVSVRFTIDPAEGTEPIRAVPNSVFPGELVIEDRNKAILIAKTGKAHLKLWCDGSKLDKGGTGAAVVWEDCASQKWQEQKLCLGLNKEIFDAEIWGVSEALKIAEKKARQVQEPWVINVFCDSQTTISNLRECNVYAGQALKLQIYQKAQKLMERGHSISVIWVPGHSGVEGNERADKAAKEAASERRVRTAKWTSLTHVKRQITEEKKLQISIWHGQKTREREASRRGFYIPSIKPQIHPLLGKAKKSYASRFYQLKTGHGAIGTFLKRIGAVESAECWWCGDREQSVLHLYTSCRKWRKERRVLKRSLNKLGVQWQRRPEKKWLAELLANERAVGPLLVYLKDTEVGSREGAVEKTREWRQRSDQEGEEQLSNS